MNFIWIHIIFPISFEFIAYSNLEKKHDITANWISFEFLPYFKFLLNSYHISNFIFAATANWSPLDAQIAWKKTVGLTYVAGRASVFSILWETCSRIALVRMGSWLVILVRSTNPIHQDLEALKYAQSCSIIPKRSDKLQSSPLKYFYGTCVQFGVVWSCPDHFWVIGFKGQLNSTLIQSRSIWM